MSDAPEIPEWHLVTGEFPPQPGGVSDYVRGVAEGLALAGDRVHVWCPPAPGPDPRLQGVQVHRELGRMSPRDLRRVGRLLDGFAPPRRLLVQWVPHSYGYRTMNLAFCLWLWRRSALRGDRVEIMVHEPYLPFSRGAWKQSAVAVVHRAMTVVLLRAADHVWVSTPAWAARWRRYLTGRRPPFTWIPIPSNVPVAADPAAARAVRDRYLPSGGCLLGHFGTYRPNVRQLLAAILPAVLERAADRAILLLGHGGEGFRTELLRRVPSLEGRIHATGPLPLPELSAHLSACDLLVQPYPDGANGRQTSLAAGLAHARAAVSTEGASTEPVWRESGAVALAPAGDAAAAVEAVERLLTDSAARRRMGEAARELYLSRFDLRHTVEALRSAR
jgi:glycosyltransferase involved in cell wall biosynthesis